MKKIFIFTMTVLILSTLAYSQPPPDFDDPAPPAPPDEISDEMLAKFRQMKIWKMTEELDITEEQAAKFYPRFNRFEDGVEEIRLQNKELLEKLRGYLTAGEEDKKIKSLISDIEKNDEKILKLHSDFRTDVEKILTTEQLGKLVLFQHEFPKKFRKSFRGKGQGREKRGGRSGMRGPLPDQSPGMGRGLYGCQYYLHQ